MSSDETRRWALVHRGMDAYAVDAMTSEEVSAAFLGKDEEKEGMPKRPRPALTYDPAKRTLIVMVDDQWVYTVNNSLITPHDRQVLGELHGRSTPKEDLRMFHVARRLAEWGPAVRILEYRTMDPLVDHWVMIRSPITEQNL